ncbi:MAG: hypothetical protein WDN76_13280 [Alphaproteobacteria bacterium]
MPRDALERASDSAWTGGGDLTLARTLAGIMRLFESAVGGRADPHVLDVSLSAARALLSLRQRPHRDPRSAG